MKTVLARIALAAAALAPIGAGAQTVVMLEPAGCAATRNCVDVTTDQVDGNGAEIHVGIYAGTSFKSIEVTGFWGSYLSPVGGGELAEDHRETIPGCTPIPLRVSCTTVVYAEIKNLVLPPYAAAGETMFPYITLDSAVFTSHMVYLGNGRGHRNWTLRSGELSLPAVAPR